MRKDTKDFDILREYRYASTEANRQLALLAKKFHALPQGYKSLSIHRDEYIAIVTAFCELFDRAEAIANELHLVRIERLNANLRGLIIEHDVRCICEKIIEEHDSI